MKLGDGIMVLSSQPDKESVYAHHHPKEAQRFCRKTARRKIGSPALVQVDEIQKLASFADLRTTFPSADQVGNLTVFNMGGNRARLIAAIHYNRRKIYVRAVLTHAEYDRGKWKE